jgi:hypothetical protein
MNARAARLASPSSFRRLKNGKRMANKLLLIINCAAQDADYPFFTTTG